ncbi:MAG: hypothetical protein GTO02_19095, partial [Candidatus Dadabacteria bacterium]|nr:hypothetical protein [Candidatus Dadabacteria bacterium]
LTENQLKLIENLINEEAMSSIIGRAEVGDVITITIKGKDVPVKIEKKVLDDQLHVKYGTKLYIITDKSFKDNSLVTYEVKPDGKKGPKVILKDVSNVKLVSAKPPPIPDEPKKGSDVDDDEVMSPQEKEEREKRIRKMIMNNPRIKTAVKVNPSLLGMLFRGRKAKYFTPTIRTSSKEDKTKNPLTKGNIIKFKVLKPIDFDTDVNQHGLSDRGIGKLERELNKLKDSGSEVSYFAKSGNIM